MPELLSPAEKTRIFLLRKTSSPLRHALRRATSPEGRGLELKGSPFGRAPAKRVRGQNVKGEALCFYFSISYLCWYTSVNICGFAVACIALFKFQERKREKVFKTIGGSKHSFKAGQSIRRITSTRDSFLRGALLLAQR